jgi:Zn-finger nucleic acid-binding protein
MKCPKCSEQMDAVTFDTIEVKRCQWCRGLWFEMLQHEDLKAIDGSEAIDIGDAELGKQYNEIDRIDCPSCSTQMIGLVDLDQPHIWYEACTVCNGVFFDAGEFADFKNRDPADYIRSLLAKERK